MVIQQKTFSNPSSLRCGLNTPDEVSQLGSMSVMGWISKGIGFQTEGWSGYTGIPYKNDQKCGFRPFCFFLYDWGYVKYLKKWDKNQWKCGEPNGKFGIWDVFFHPDGSQFGWQRDTWSGAKHAMRKNTKHSSFVEKAKSVSINMSQWLFRALIVRIPNCSQNNS